MRKTQLLLIKNKLHWHRCGLLRGHRVSEKLPKITLFAPSLIHRLRLLGSQQHPQSGWISATAAKWSPFNFIFNMGNRKWSGFDTSGEYAE
jgi:hypothetical protein